MAEEPVSMETNDDVVMTETSDIHSPNELAEVEIDEARKHYEAKDYKLALVSYSNAIALCPDVAKYYGNRAACYMMLDRYRDALIDARTSVELDPNFVKGYIRVIRCCLKLGEIVEAETTLNKLSQVDPTQGGQSSPEATDLLHVKRFVQEADAAMEIKDYRKVVYCMDRCCDISRYCIRFKLTKAECLAYLGRYQDAQEIANDVLLLDRSNIDATYVRGICLYHQDNVDKGFMHFQEVLRLAPDHTKALEIYKRAKKLMQTKEAGNAHFKSGKYQEAYDLYTEALTIDPENKIACTKLHYNRALTAAKLGRLNESISECTEALNIDENYQKAILKRASCYMELQEYEEAVRDYERVCRINKSRDNRRLLMEAKEALKRSKKKDYYKILGVEKTASIDDIKKAYRKRALVHHPDRHSSASDTEKKEQEKKFKEIGEAYTILSDPKKRARYDRGGDMDEFENGFEYARYQESPFEAFFNKSDGGFKFQFSGGRENFPF